MHRAIRHLSIAVCSVVYLLFSSANISYAKELLTCSGVDLVVEKTKTDTQVIVTGFKDFMLTTSSTCDLESTCVYQATFGQREESWNFANTVTLDGLCRSITVETNEYKNKEFGTENQHHTSKFESKSAKRILISSPEQFIALVEVRYHNLPEDYRWNLWHGTEHSGASLTYDLVEHSISIY